MADQTWDYNDNGPSSDQDKANAGVLQSTAGGAGAGAAVGGPWGALIGAAGGLLLGLMNNKSQSEQQQYNAKLQEHMRQQNALDAAQQSQIANVGNMGNRENSAISNLIGVFGRAR